jgi:hypothetical protein
VSRVSRLDVLARIVLGASAAVLLVLVPGVPGSLRAAVAVAWFLAVPGLAWVRALPVDGPVEQFAAVVALSVALDVLAAEATVYVGLAGVLPALVLLLAVTGLGLVVGGRRVAVAA